MVYYTREMKKSLSILAVFFALPACAPGLDQHANMTDEEIFTRARTRTIDGNFRGAVADFEALDNQHPYSRFTARAQLLGGYANYRAGRFSQASDLFENYIRFQPSSTNIQYATYMAARSNFARMRRVERDQRETQIAANLMERIIREWPDSAYAADAPPMLERARSTLAAKYMRNGAELSRNRNFLAALNHYRAVITRFADTPYAPEAYFRTAEILRIIGSNDEAERVTALLREKFPESDFAR